MALTEIQVVADTGFAEDIAGIAAKFEVLDYSVSPTGGDGRQRHFLLTGKGDRQGLVDALQGLLGSSETARIVLATVEATIPPEPEEPEDEETVAEKRREALGATREELYSNVAHGADLSSDYLLLTVLSTVVAAIGLIEDNVAVVIGAMVIAPLLGPNLAFSLGGALGDARLMLRAIATGGAGLAIAGVLGIAIGASQLFGVTSGELMSRTQVGLDSIALALASGAAAVLSITSGLSSTLVGVMVAVALLPPVATAGIMLGAGNVHHALGALLLLMVNVSSVNLAALAVFLFRGIRPRTWLERRAAKQSARLSVVAWLALLALLVTMILVWEQPSIG